MPTDPATPDNPAPTIDWETLARYLAGESSLDESERIARWLAEHPADSQLLASLDNALANLSLRDAHEVDVEAALQRVTINRDAPDPAVDTRIPASPHVVPLSGKRSFPWRVLTALAAAAVVIFAARTLLLPKDSATGSPSTNEGARTFASVVGKRDSLLLPDGGRVVLSPASELTIAAGYGKGIREVKLHGEAYFEVNHDTTRPFVVHAGDAVIRDIGTAFAVRSDSGAAVQVVVTVGSVSLGLAASSDSATTLAAGEIGTLEIDGRVSVQRGASTAPYLAWMRDSLVFKDASLAQVGADLQRWYGVSLRVGDSSLARRHLTMSFTDDPIDRVLRVIGLGLGAEIERRGDTAILRRAQ
jgi:transmembrane sensor